MRTPISIAALVLSLALSASALPQAGAGGVLPSRAQGLEPTAAVEVLPPVDVAALLAEDELSAGKAAPFRFGFGQEVSLGLESGGAWEDLEDGTSLWRLRVESPGAWSLNLIFDRYVLPEGARLFVHNDAGQVLGAFTSELNQPHGLFATEPIAGDALTLEYSVPRNGPLGELRLSEVIHAYKNILAQPGLDHAGHQTGGPGGQKASGACNINVNCPLGANWQDQKRSSARLVMGGVLCSGSLINNTASDSKQYFMTANHCYSGNPGTWVFNFNYESPTCNGTTGSAQSVTGSQLRLKGPQADFCLVEITQNIPASYNAYFAGWSRSTTPSTTSTGIHHPQGDIKKICQDTNSVTSASFGGAPCWRVASWEQGVTEPGSSGSPLYDQNKRYIGQLYGGQATCSFLFNDYYGRFDVSMNNGLAAWLDPLGTGQVTLNGINDGAGNTTTTYCTAKLSSNFCFPAMSFSGVPSLSLPSGFTMTTSGMETGVVAIDIFGTSGQASIPFQGGILCIAGSVSRLGGKNSGGLGTCGGSVSYTLADVLAHPAASGVGAGSSVYVQTWSRDIGDPFGSSLSNAVQVSVAP